MTEAASGVSEFLARWRVRPFVPFVVRLADGREVEVASPERVAATPDESLFMVLLSASRMEAMPAVLIAGCRDPGVTAAAPPPPVVTAPEPASERSGAASGPSAAHVKAMEFALGSGRRVRQVSVAGCDGVMIFTTAGTRWDCHGLERFENGCTLYLHHTDDPLRQRRVIVWPPRKATLSDFSAAASPGEIQRVLAEEDAAAHGDPKGVAAAVGWEKAAAWGEGHRPASDVREFRGETEGEEDWSRFEMKFEPMPYGRDGEIAEAWMVDTRTKTVMFDLRGGGWDARASGDAALRRLDLRRPEANPDGTPGPALALWVQPMAMTARIEVGEEKIGERPLGWTGRVLANFALHGSWKGLLAALRRGPDAGKPEVTLHAKGWTIELWAAGGAPTSPFLQPRILTPRGQAALDWRGTAWGARVGVWGRGPGVTLWPLGRDAVDRRAGSSWTLDVDLPSERVSNPAGKSRNDWVAGSTCLSRLHMLGHSCRGWDVLWGGLRDEFALGAGTDGATPRPGRVVESTDGAWRAELYESGLTEMAADGTRKPYWFVRLMKDDGRLVLDTRSSHHVAWLVGDGREMQITVGAQRGVPGETWTAVDLDRGEFWEENFREPVSEARSLEDLAEYLVDQDDR